MDKLSKTIQSLESGEIQVPHLELTDQQGEHLQKAIRSTFVARSLKTNRYLVDNPDECYFVERTLSELGILKPNKHMSAHEEFVGLLMVLQVEIPERLQPINVHRLADGNQLITTDFYPWKATPVETRDEELRSLAATDLMRWHAIYLYLRNRLSAPTDCDSTPKARRN